MTTFNISTEAGLKAAEKHQQTLYKKFNKVNVSVFGLNKIKITEAVKNDD